MNCPVGSSISFGLEFLPHLNTIVAPILPEFKGGCCIRIKATASLAARLCMRNASYEPSFHGSHCHAYATSDFFRWQPLAVQFLQLMIAILPLFMPSHQHKLSMRRKRRTPVTDRRLLLVRQI